MYLTPPQTPNTNDTMTCLATIDKGRAPTHVRTSNHRYPSRLLRSEQIPDDFKLDYITNGYRSPGLSFCGCVQSLFAWHNESTNIWSHVTLALTYVAIVCYLQASGDADFLRDRYALPLLVLISGHTLCASFSSCAHALFCMSVDVKHVCFYLDYAGVSSLGLTVAVGYYYYSRPIRFGCYEQPTIYFGATILSCAVGCYLTCGTRLQWTQMPHQFRLAGFAVPYFVSMTPLVQRMVYETHWEPVCSLHLLHIGFTVVGSFIYGVKIPERFVPNLFDYNFHSHCLMHILTGIGALIQMYATFVDMKMRRHLLLRGDDLTVFDVFWPVGVISTIQIFIVGLYCYKLVKLRRRETENMKLE